MQLAPKHRPARATQYGVDARRQTTAGFLSVLVIASSLACAPVAARSVLEPLGKVQAKPGSSGAASGSGLSSDAATDGLSSSLDAKKGTPGPKLSVLSTSTSTDKVIPKTFGDLTFSGGEKTHPAADKPATKSSAGGSTAAERANAKGSSTSGLLSSPRKTSALLTSAALDKGGGKPASQRGAASDESSSSIPLAGKPVGVLTGSSAVSDAAASADSLQSSGGAAGGLAKAGKGGDKAQPGMPALGGDRKAAALLNPEAGSDPSIASLAVPSTGAFMQEDLLEDKARWMDCEESWWRQCFKDGKIVQPLAVQAVYNAVGKWLGSEDEEYPAIERGPRPRGAEQGAQHNDKACLQFEAMPRDLDALCHPYGIHVVVTLDKTSFRGALATINSVLSNAACPQRLFFHLPLLLDADHAKLAATMQDTFDNVHIYWLNQDDLSERVSSFIHADSDKPVNFIRYFMDRFLPVCLERVVYLDSDLIMTHDIRELWEQSLGGKVAGAPMFCHDKVRRFFHEEFWSNPHLSEGVQNIREECSFDPGVMVVNLTAWQAGQVSRQMEYWLDRFHDHPSVSDLRSLAPALLTLAGRLHAIDPAWNRHSLGFGCQEVDMRTDKVLHWSGEGKPWQRLGTPAECAVDREWVRYDISGPAVKTPPMERSARSEPDKAEGTLTLSHSQNPP